MRMSEEAVTATMLVVWLLVSVRDQVVRNCESSVINAEALRDKGVIAVSSPLGRVPPGKTTGKERYAI